MPGTHVTTIQKIPCLKEKRYWNALAAEKNCPSSALDARCIGAAVNAALPTPSRSSVKPSPTKWKKNWHFAASTGFEIFQLSPQKNQAIFPLEERWLFVLFTPVFPRQ